MEDALVPDKYLRISKKDIVLILVLMEDALVRLCAWFPKQQYPCVLILVLMEDALVPPLCG